MAMFTLNLGSYSVMVMLVQLLKLMSTIEQPNSVMQHFETNNSTVLTLI